jgi:hypothetical protein
LNNCERCGVRGLLAVLLGRFCMKERVDLCWRVFRHVWEELSQSVDGVLLGPYAALWAISLGSLHKLCAAQLKTNTQSTL